MNAATAARGRTPPLKPLLDRWLFRIGRPEAAPIRLGQRRIFVLPTAVGLFFAATLLTMLLTSMNYGLSLGYGLTFLLGGIAIASIVHAFRNLLHLSLSPGRAGPVFRGETAQFPFFIDNPRSARRPALRLRGSGGETVFDLAPATATSVTLPCPALRRGIFTPGRTVLETTWPLGLIRAWSVFVPQMDCLVYPTPEADAPPLPTQGAGGTHEGRAGKEGDDDFDGLRPWRMADSPRHIAWKVFARGGPLMTRQFSGSSGGELLLDWAALPAVLDGERRLSRLTAWVLAAERSGVNFALTLPGAAVPPGRGPAHTHACLRLLALYGLTPPDVGLADV